MLLFFRGTKKGRNNLRRVLLSLWKICLFVKDKRIKRDVLLRTFKLIPGSLNIFVFLVELAYYSTPNTGRVVFSPKFPK